MDKKQDFGEEKSVGFFIKVHKFITPQIISVGVWEYM